MIESIDKLETMPALFAVRGVRGGRKIRAKPVMSHLAYYVIDEPRRIVFIIDVAAGAQGPNATNMRATHNVASEPEEPSEKPSSSAL